MGRVSGSQLCARRNFWCRETRLSGWPDGKRPFLSAIPTANKSGKSIVMGSSPGFLAGASPNLNAGSRPSPCAMKPDPFGIGRGLSGWQMTEIQRPLLRGEPPRRPNMRHPKDGRLDQFDFRRSAIRFISGLSKNGNSPSIKTSPMISSNSSPRMRRSAFVAAFRLITWFLPS